MAKAVAVTPDVLMTEHHGGTPSGNVGRRHLPSWFRYNFVCRRTSRTHSGSRPSTNELS
jgi:hypothetical protein